MQAKIPFNKPFIAGKELYYIAQAVTFGNIGGDGQFTQQCCRLLEERFGIHKVLAGPVLHGRPGDGGDAAATWGRATR